MLQAYGSSENSYHPASPHSIIVCHFCFEHLNIFNASQVRPTSTADVVSIVNIARKYRIPVVPYSGATSLEGHFSGVFDFLCVTTAPELATVSFWQCLLGYVRHESYS